LLSTAIPYIYQFINGIF